MRHPLLVVMIVLAASAAPAGETPAASRQAHPSGIFTHGDSSDFLEEAYGNRVEPMPREEASPARKHDPAIRWDAPATQR